jgi:hypothetical protein
MLFQNKVPGGGNFPAPASVKPSELTCPVHTESAMNPDFCRAHRCLLWRQVASVTWLLFCFICGPAETMARPAPVGPGPVVVHSKFGGQIFGFDIDQNGTEGVLSESKLLSGDKVLAAVETFDQLSGQILAVVSKTMNKDDFVTLGIAGGSVGVVEQEQVRKLYVSKRVYNVLDPLNGNAFTGCRL